MTTGRNLELKARDRDPERSKRNCAELGAVDKGTLFQVDTYFEVPHGRLKLREQSPGAAELIAYERADERGDKESSYRLVPVADPTAMKEALTAALGVHVTVHKERRLYVWEGVRIHLDHVENLGDFIEFEGVTTADALAQSFVTLLDHLRNAFAIRDEDLIAVSYSDLIEERGEKLGL
jgi:adenylate cyclase class 2